MRTILLFGALALAPSLVSAQASFRLADPALSIGNQRIVTTGAPLSHPAFDLLTIQVPGDGTYQVSDQPFAGARRVGQFEDDGLFFAVQGRSVRLRSSEPILSTAGPVSAYVRYEPTRGRAYGPARLSVSGMRGRQGYAEQAPRRRTEPRRLTSTPPPSSTRETTRLQSELERVVQDRQRLAADRDRLVQERQMALQERDRYAAMLSRASRRTASGWTDARIQSLSADRDRLDAERQRLVRERDDLDAARRQAEAERARLTAELAVVRQRAEYAGRIDADTRRMEAEIASLRDQLRERDEAIAVLRAESTDRTGQMPAVDAQIRQLRADLAEATAARERALADRNAAYAQRDDALLQVDLLTAERNRLRSLVDGRPGVGDAALTDIDALRRALDRDRRLLDQDRAALAAERQAFEEMRRSALDDPSTDDRQRLLLQLEQAQAEREALVDERDRLARELDALRRGFEAGQGTNGTATGRPSTPRTDGPVVALPDFEFDRLENPDVIRRRLQETEYPRWATLGRIDGDVLVLFQTDPTGRVVRTAVPRPIGGGLDELAESIVREMRFRPSVVAGQATGLRSQVLVRFDL